MERMPSLGFGILVSLASVLIASKSSAQTNAESVVQRLGTVAASAERPAAVSRQGLDDPSLNLSAAQKNRIDTLIEGYLAEQRAVQAKYPPSMSGGRPSPELVGTMAAVRDKFASSVNAVLDESQRKTWVALQQSARPNRGVSPKGTLPNMIDNK